MADQSPSGSVKQPKSEGGGHYFFHPLYFTRQFTARKWSSRGRAKLFPSHFNFPWLFIWLFQSIMSKFCAAFVIMDYSCLYSFDIEKILQNSEYFPDSMRIHFFNSQHRYDRIFVSPSSCESANIHIVKVWHSQFIRKTVDHPTSFAAPELPIHFNWVIKFGSFQASLHALMSINSRSSQPSPQFLLFH
jgi:hypothetical protein